MARGPQGACTATSTARLRDTPTDPRVLQTPTSGTEKAGRDNWRPQWLLPFPSSGLRTCPAHCLTPLLSRPRLPSVGASPAEQPCLPDRPVRSRCPLSLSPRHPASFMAVPTGGNDFTWFLLIFTFLTIGVGSANYGPRPNQIHCSLISSQNALHHRAELSPCGSLCLRLLSLPIREKFGGLCIGQQTP